MQEEAKPTEQDQVVVLNDGRTMPLLGLGYTFIFFGSA